MMFTKILFLSVLYIEFNSAQILQDGRCNTALQLQDDFRVEDFSGIWFNVKSTISPLQSGDCSTLEITPRENIVSGNNTIDIKIRSLEENFLKEIIGVATVENGTAKINANFESLSQTINIEVGITDYENYALIYSCENVGTTQRRVHIWALGRTTEFSSEMMTNLMNTMLSNNFNLTMADLSDIDHSELACYILPEIAPGQLIVLPGQCDSNITVVQDFSPSQFQGVWHQISSYYTPNSEGKCNRAQYTLQGDVVQVVNSEVINQTLRTISGSATLTSLDGSTRLLVTLEVTPNITVTRPLWILATDYENYAVSYTCEDLGNNQKQVTSWILSRTRQLSNLTRVEVDRVIDSYYDLNRRYYADSDQSDEACFFYPEPEPGKSVIFRGQCDQTIRPVQNFRAVDYLGLWHNIESYPSTHQQGTCVNARYSLAADGTVDVFNTQVINETLLTIDGVARVTSDDGSAKLTVTFPVDGTNQTISTNYWVLATDYESYSLVYSCTNLTSDEILVFGWKLSRTKELPETARPIFEEVMRNISVLDERYFEMDDQSTAGCFYYPEPKPGVPVVFPGKCTDNEVSVINNFNATAFMGEWYEIKAYPKEFQPGQCIKHSYTSSGNNLEIQTSSVEDQFLITTISTLETNGTNGQLSINTPGPNGTTISIPFWILSVDYEDYALAYSCVDLEDDKRAIYSWQLSRSQYNLSIAAETTINNVISNVVVLDGTYYENIDQSNDACFYLPDLAPGEPVILVGQCEVNVPTVQNFNATAYLGRWRLIESYPADQQADTCTEAEYSLGSNDTIVVVNSQVVNQELERVIGSAVLDGNGKFIVTFPNNSNVSVPIWILDTDYTSYSLVYSCTDLPNNQMRVYSWKMSREKSLTSSAVTNINRVIDSMRVLNNRYFQYMNHSDDACFYYPEPGPNPVIFRGQCDPNINVVTNFNASGYLNLWHNIESYPSAFQTGTCNNAFYSPGTTSAVDVYNTQVIERRLDSINGTADLAGAANIGKLIVTFPIAGTNLTTTTDYWILATDYISYALVYTCYNVDEEHRAVLSWKLSRTKSLSDAALNAINVVVNSIPVLDSRYYQPDDQTDEGCFYFPDPEPGKVVEFPGRCNQSIQAVPNFNLTSFGGTWYEIQAYPKEQQTGQCVSHTYSVAEANALRLISSQVLNQDLILTNSDVRFSSSQDSSGKLTITIDTGASDNVTIPYWVLSTDYTDFALAYSCVDIENDRRRVFSWKLSRSKTLSNAANTAITSAINNIDVLDSRYYENIDQSDSACFYLPDVPLGQPVIFPGQCDPDIEVVRDFNVTAYAGRWRMIETYYSEFQRGQCNDATYTLLADGTVSALNTQVIDQELDTIIGNVTLASDDGSAKLSVKFPNTDEAADYWVLGTDYDSYALVYSCRNLDNNQRRVWSWKLSRTRELTDTAKNNITNLISNINVLNSRYYATINHTDNACFYYPEPNGRPVTFRGQCDENITVVSNFRAADYLNLWHNIESYPSAFQNGTCNNAFYSPGTTSAVDVYNTQVIERRLDSINGTADLAGAADIGKLIVTFPIAGTNLTTTTDYWILATDYISYALVYTCYNVDEEHRTVLSWKLSRTKSLSDAALNAINVVVNSIPVLDSRYYEPDDQTDEGCFYFPDPEPGKVVEFPGRCNQSIQAVPNFNLTSFGGTWYEIQAYPKEQQTGQCVSHTYSVAEANALRLISSQVLNQDLILTNSDVRFSSSQDSSGKLTITIDTGASDNVTIPYWVLSTDYTDFALAYSCVDIENDRRRVFSWKLSRSKTLSNAANTAITSAISNIDVLDSRYYENIDQSDSACFYLPDVPLGQPVIFPGQCDPDIEVVRDFNVTAYAGRWRMIETYYSEFQRGQCNDATYTLLADGTVSALNTQVIDQELDTIIGNVTLASDDGSAKLSVKFPNTDEAADYWVLGIDYDSYALVYSCRNLDNNQRRVWSWKLSRTTELSETADRNINAIISNIDVLNIRYFDKINNSNDACFYYPEANGQPLVFRGPCDDNVPLVTNFNAADYLGTWYDIESYPTGFQLGLCPTATYSLNGSVVDVYNTEVVNDRLSFINGVATPYADGSSRLNVSFPIAGTNLTINSPYWVLATDYINYALVYSCVNDETNENRRVSSWKLSRSKSLTDASRRAIDEVMNSVRVLRDKYYNVRGHSDDDCFYYPENNGGPVEMTGDCAADTIAVNNFDMQSFSGSWYEISRYPSELRSGECVSNEFVASNNTFRMTKSFVSDEKLVEASGSATLSNDGRGILNVTLTDNSGASYETTMYVIDVEYSDYALLYGCRSLGNGMKQVYSWKLSRNQTGLSSQAVNNINEVVNATRDLWDGYYEVTDQTDNGCFHYPDYETLPEEITLIGACDESIEGVPNFNAAAYLGDWVEIASYPQRFQNGDCARAYYSTEDGAVVNVMNTQVVNRTLDVAFAIATVASNDGSGVLNVTFTMPVSTTTNYYILATDYTSYSLVYSCRNLAGGGRQVGSWKLSRNKTLSLEAEAIMDNAINNTEGLYQSYYTPTSQTEDACFYIPEADRNTPPLFRGQCQDVQGMQGFDLQKYTGWWHEIESYPSANGVGSCVSSELIATGNTYQMIDISVSDNIATVVNSTVTATNDGRLTKTFNDGTVSEMLVLATDYETFSLLYTCENVNDEFKRVWSAKHSKSRQLSQEAQNIISNYTADNRVLEEQFYFAVNQSDSACFYYPEVTGDQVILPGQCDENIPVEQSFDAAQYTGTWYQVERYPQRFESGNCTGARYSLNTDTGVVTVLNWQVIDGELDTVEGNATINSTDGSAKLVVNLPVRNTDDPNPPMVSMELYVLQTDYVSYSLAYSCVNVDPYHRAIGAWKLSRTRTLTEAGNAAINTYTVNRPEFNENYFIAVGQNDNCPEPSSGVLVKSSFVILILSVIILNIF